LERLHFGPKSKIHIDGDWHRAAHIWFINSRGELLIQRRAKIKINYPNMWDISAAGHVSAGENSDASALREIEEEIGIKLEKKKLKFLGSLVQQSVLNEGTYIDNEHNDVYLAEMEIDPDTLVLQEEEVEKVMLIHWKELQRWVDENREDLVPHPDEYKLLFDYLKKNIG